MYVGLSGVPIVIVSPTLGHPNHALSLLMTKSSALNAGQPIEPTKTIWQEFEDYYIIGG